MAAPVSRRRRIVAKVAFWLVIGLAALGAIWSGFSADVRERVWQGLIDRPSGPMAFRFILQPVMAAIAAFADARGDVRAGRKPYLWNILTHPGTSAEQLNDGLISTGRIILLGLVMDTFFQIVEFGTFYPAEAAIIAVLLAFVPYLILRGPFARLIRWWGRKSENK